MDFSVSSNGFSVPKLTYLLKVNLCRHRILTQPLLQAGYFSEILGDDNIGGTTEVMADDDPIRSIEISPMELDAFLDLVSLKVSVVSGLRLRIHRGLT